MSTTKWLVDKLLPEREIHLLGGPSGAGKTRWIISTFLAWQHGEPVLGYASHPVPWLYLITDRSHRDFEQTLSDMGVDAATFPYFAADRINRLRTCGYDAHNLDDLLRYTQEHITPRPRLIIIENMGRFCPDSNSQSAVSIFLTTLRDSWCNERDLTLIGVREYTKMLPKNRYTDPLDRMSGASTWRNHSNLILMLEHDLDSDLRVLTVASRSLPRFEAWYEFNSRGLLIPTADPEEDLYKRLAMGFLLSNQEFSTDMFISHFTNAGASRASAYRQLKMLVARGLIIKLSHGLYRVNTPSATYT